MQPNTIWLRLRAILTWIFLSFVLLTWNKDFYLFRWWTWADYRNVHPDKLALSILVFGVITYFTLEGLTNSNAKVDFDRTFRIGLLLLGTVLLLEIGGLSQKLDHAIEVTVDGSVSVDGSALSSDPIKVEVER